MTDGRHLATVRSYDELIQALRRRSDELKVSRETLDSISGLNSGYCGKRLSSQPVKRLGRVSMAPLLMAMGCALILVEDPVQLAKIQKRLIRRKWWNGKAQGKPDTRHMIPTTRRRRRWTFPSGPEFAKLMNARRNLALSEDQRSASARHAVNCRWRHRHRQQGNRRCRSRVWARSKVTIAGQGFATA